MAILFRNFKKNNDQCQKLSKIWDWRIFLTIAQNIVQAIVQKIAKKTTKITNHIIRFVHTTHKTQNNLIFPFNYKINFIYSYLFQHFWHHMSSMCIMHLLPRTILRQQLLQPAMLVSAFNIPNFLVDNVSHSINCFFLISAFYK